MTSCSNPKPKPKPKPNPDPDPDLKSTLNQNANPNPSPNQVRNELLLECHPPVRRGSDGSGDGGGDGGSDGSGDGGGDGGGGGRSGGGGGEGEGSRLLSGEAWRQRGYRWAGAAGGAAADALPVHGHALIVGGWKLLQLGQVHPHEEAGWHPPPGQDTSATKYSLGCDLSQQPASVAASECVGAPCLFDLASELHVEPKPQP